MEAENIFEIHPLTQLLRITPQVIGWLLPAYLRCIARLLDFSVLSYSSPTRLRVSSPSGGHGGHLMERKVGVTSQQV
jgi:hypothetical protein